jgi:hypothetical protein
VYRLHRELRGIEAVQLGGQDGGATVQEWLVEVI